MPHVFSWEGITVAITHTSNWLNTGYDHVELRAENRLPVTTTGYRSLFIPADDLSLFNTVEEFVSQWLDQEAASRAWQDHLMESRQMSLF